MRWEWGSEATTAICIGAFLMLSWVLAFLHWLGYRKWTRTRGKVVRMAEQVDSDGDTLYAPIVAFTTEGGQRVEFTEPVFTSTRDRKGEKVAVIYPPARPQDARVAGNVYVLQVGIGAFGLLFVIAGLFFLRQ